MRLKENRGIGLTSFVIAILIILLIIAVLACVYLLKNPNTENSAPVTNLNSLSEVKENINKTTGTTSQEKYKIWVENVEKEIGKAKENALFQSVKISNDKTCEVSLTSKGILSFTLENQGSREVDKDVISFEICDIGNGGYKAVYYIKKDGTAYYVVLDEYQKNDEEIKPTQVKDAKNIVSIINNTYTDEPSWSAEVWLIDIDGNVYKQ